MLSGGSDDQEVCTEVSEGLSCWYHKEEEGVPEDQGKRAPLAASGVNLGWEKRGWTSVTSQPEQKCLIFLFLSRKKQDKNSGGGQVTVKCRAGHYQIT